MGKSYVLNLKWSMQMILLLMHAISIHLVINFMIEGFTQERVHVFMLCLLQCRV